MFHDLNYCFFVVVFLDAHSFHILAQIVFLAALFLDLMFVFPPAMGLVMFGLFWS